MDVDMHKMQGAGLMPEGPTSGWGSWEGATRPSGGGHKASPPLQKVGGH